MIPNKKHVPDPMQCVSASTSVHPQETNVDSKPQDLWGNSVGIQPAESQASDAAWALRIPEPSGPGDRFATPIASQLEIDFRHDGWREDRQRVRESMARTGLPITRRERFDQCGAMVTIEFSLSENRHRLRGSYCHDRLCQACGRSRSNFLGAGVAKHIGTRRTRFLTLTLKHNFKPLVEQVQRLKQCFRNLRNQKFWKGAVIGGIGFIEVKRSKDGRTWHPHFHCLVEGKYIPQDVLSRQWLIATGDSDVVDIRAVREVGDATRYVAKYASKPIEHRLYQNPEWLDEAAVALRGQRLYIPFGTWRGVDFEGGSVEASDWKLVCSLASLVDAVSRGERWAADLWKMLRKSESPEKPSAP